MEGVALRAVVRRSWEAIKTPPELLPAHILRFTDPTRVFADPEIDCVVIATPASSHFGLARDAILSRKHVLVEKPMTCSCQEAIALRNTLHRTRRTLEPRRDSAFALRADGPDEVASMRDGMQRRKMRGTLSEDLKAQMYEEQNVQPTTEASEGLPVFMVGHQYVYNDYIRYLKDEVQKGSLGKIRYIFAEHFYPGPIRSDVGCFWETAPHELSIIEYIFGPPKIVRIEGRAAHFSDKGRDDYTSVEITYEDGLHATIVTSWFAPVKVRRMIMAGEKGMALFDESVPKSKLQFVIHPYPVRANLNNRSSYFFDIPQADKVIPDIVVREPLRVQLEHFVACIRTGMMPMTNIDHGLRIIGSLERIYKAIA
jgi:predicted dehydrogenase